MYLFLLTVSGSICHDSFLDTQTEVVPLYYWALLRTLHPEGCTLAYLGWYI